MKIKNILNKIKWYALITLMFAGGLYYYFGVYSADDTVSTVSFYVVDTVERGEVTSGIQTTGNIIAAQKLDIDVYKQLSRIDVVKVANGTHIEEGDILISFDKSDAYVDTESARVSVSEAELALEEERVNATNPSTAIRTKENQITGYKKTIVDAKQDIEDAYRDFLNEDLETDPHPDKYDNLIDQTAPTLSGRYIADIEGEFVITTYSSGANSGYSYTISGLGGGTNSVVIGAATSLGSGLEIIFPMGTKGNEKWIAYVPNTKIATYEETKRDYEQTVTNLEKTIVDAKVNLANAEQELENLQLMDTNSYRDLNVEKAGTTLAEARQRLSQNYDIIQERNIVAPFSGTVEGMKNVVVGATPVGGTSDSINLGTLISDEFLITFSLGAADVAKVEVGQKVKVTVTSFVEQPAFEATITQISSLPESSGVAQYDVQALLNYDRNTADIVLREGMLADVEVVKEENQNALRVPTAAITYEQGTPKVTVVDKLSEQQTQQAYRMGIIRTDGTTLTIYDVEVILGIVGQYYVEVLGGLEEGDIIVTSSLSEATTESVVQQAGFRPGGEQHSPGAQGGRSFQGGQNNRQSGGNN